MNAKYIHFLYQSSKSKKEKQAILNSKLNFILEFSKSIHKSDYIYYIDDKILNFIIPISNLLEYHQIKDIIYSITIRHHIPTYIHSRMVHKIANVMGKYAIKYMPNQFVGILGYNLEEVLNHQEEILNLLDEAASFHDIGKWVCIDVISNSSRKLEEIEFQLIKEHPSFGYNLIKDSSFPSAVKDTILLHHLAYNKKIGYPHDFTSTSNQAIVDIVTICDCIDAATDFVGRPYAQKKTLKEVREELLDGKNTRYSPFVDLLTNQELFEKIEKITNEDRIRTINEILHQEIKIKTNS